LKTWFLFYHWMGFWKGHRAGIRTGNAELQIQCLSAFAPLFPIAGKVNYTRSTVHFLAILTRHPRIKTLLKYAASVNLTQDGHYFAFDEALETFGVKFIKQNVTGNIINEEELKRQIKAAQSEKERMNLLFDEFLGDIVLSTGTRAVNRRREILWKLTKQLIEAFEMIDGTQHSLFQNCDQLTSEGFDKLFCCYKNGITRLDKIFRQEILHLEVVDTKGRRAKGVITTKVTDLKSKTSKTKGKNTQPSNDSLAESLGTLTIETGISSELNSTIEYEPVSKKIKRHHPSKEEREVLESLFVYDTMPSDAAIDSVLTILLTYWDGWTKKKIKSAWNYEKRKGNRKQEKNKT
jgi:hypothetical protein